MKLIVTKGATSVSVNVFIRDNSVSTGVGLTGLAYNTASLTAYYSRQNAAATAITLATQTATGAYSSGGFVAVDGTNMPGLYRLDIPDAVLATGVNTAYICLKGATNMEPCFIEIELAAFDLQSSAPSVAVASIAANAITAASAAADFGTEIRDAIILRTTLRGTASGTPTTTSIPTSAMSPATSVADQVKGRIVIFDYDTTTAALRGQATDITASSASATPTLTVTALTTAPVSGDTFTIV